MTIPIEFNNLKMVFESSAKRKYFPYEIGMILFQSNILEDDLFKHTIIFDTSFNSIPDLLDKLYQLYQNQLIPICKYIDGINDDIVPVTYLYQDDLLKFTSEKINVIENTNQLFNVFILIATHIENKCIYPLSYVMHYPETLFTNKSIIIDYTINY